MFDQMLDTFRKATESTLQLQQEMMRNLTSQWGQATSGAAAQGGAAMGAAWLDQIRGFQKTWGNSVSDMLNKHREALDAQYRAGIKTIEDAFRVGEAKDPEQFRRLAEQLWRQSFDTLRTLSETQMRDFQAAAEKWYEAVAKGVPGGKG